MIKAVENVACDFYSPKFDFELLFGSTTFHSEEGADESQQKNDLLNFKGDNRHICMVYQIFTYTSIEEM
jgi:hypothetical protein